MKKAIVALFTVLILMAGCSTTECPVCSKNPWPEPKCPVLVCPSINTSNCSAKETVRYVCQDQRAVDSPAKCFLPPEPVAEPEPVVLADISDLKVSNHTNDGVMVKKFRVTPACVKSKKGGEIFYEVGSVAQETAFEAKKTGETEFKQIFGTAGRYNSFNYFTICDTETCRKTADFMLDENSGYILRIKFVYDWGVYYTSEKLVDTRPGKEFDKQC